MKFPVLGFLIDRPMHGYELKRAISPAVPAGQTVNDGVLYPLLKKLEREGLVTKRVEQAGKAPSRNVYRPTKAGRDEFTRWLQGADDERDAVAYDFLIADPFLAKCLFFKDLEADVIVEKLRTRIDSSQAKLAEFERIREGMVERDVDRYRVAVLELGIAQQRVKIEWLERKLASERRRRQRTLAAERKKVAA